MSRSRRRIAITWLCVVQAGEMKKWKQDNHKVLRSLNKKELNRIKRDLNHESPYYIKYWEYSNIWASPSDGTYLRKLESDESDYYRVLRK